MMQSKTETRRSTGRRGTRPTTPGISRDTLANRFPTNTAYGDLPELSLAEGEVITLDRVLEQMTSAGQEAMVPAIALTFWIAAFRGKSSGHAMRHGTILLRQIAPSEAATASAKWYLHFARQMDNAEALATARLVQAEGLLLDYINGRKISLARLADTLEVIATHFQALPGCAKLEGGARAMLALVQLRQSSSATGSTDPQFYGESISTMRIAIKMLGEGYDVPNVSQILAPLDLISGPASIIASQNTRAAVPA
jgi:hypothetical protein